MSQMKIVLIAGWVLVALVVVGTFSDRQINKAREEKALLIKYINISLTNQVISIRGSQYLMVKYLPHQKVKFKIETDKKTGKAIKVIQ